MHSNDKFCIGIYLNNLTFGDKESNSGISGSFKFRIEFCFSTENVDTLIY